MVEEVRSRPTARRQDSSNGLVHAVAVTVHTSAALLFTVALNACAAQPMSTATRGPAAETAAKETPAVAVIFQGHCRQPSPRLERITADDLSRVLQPHMLGEPLPNAQSHPVLLVLRAGQFPTAGYRADVSGNLTVRGQTGVLSASLITPPPDALVAQVVTQPCTIIGLSDIAITHIAVQDAGGKLTAELDL